VARRTPLVLLLASASALTACAATPIASFTASPIAAQAPSTTTATTTATATSDPDGAGTTPPVVPTAPSATAPGAPSTTLAAGPPALPTTTQPVSGPPIEQVVDVGNAKPERFYDDYLSTALNDIQTWWAEQYPELFGDAFVPLEGGIFAAYPERTTAIPGCGGSGDSTYQDVSDAGAFYCPIGDFIAYDDGEDGVVYQLAETYGPSIVAVVMAHEFGHAIQQRLGTLDRDVPTVYTEQQADCFSGAWARRAWNGQAPGLPFTDSDVELGLIALVTVRDPIGNDVLEPGGHGSAFDRIGAFQEGFYYDLESCADLIDHPLPLQRNEFNNESDAANNGNAVFGDQPGQVIDLLNEDLRTYWPAQLAASGATMPELKITPVTDPTVNNCGDPVGLAESLAIFCSSSNEILFDVAGGRELYDDFGDFAVGYLIGRAWAEGVQTALGSPLQGESRGLASDCLTGAWIASAIAPEPGVSPPNHVLTISPGDLDEAVQTALVVGDPGLHDDIDGSAFERVAYLRLGVLNGLPACLAPIQA